MSVFPSAVWIVTCWPLTDCTVANTASIWLCASLSEARAESTERLTDCPLANVSERSDCSRSLMERSRFNPVLLLAATVIGNTPELMVTDALLILGVNVHTAPTAQVPAGVTNGALELF